MSIMNTIEEKIEEASAITVAGLLFSSISALKVKQDTRMRKEGLSEEKIEFNKMVFKKAEEKLEMMAGLVEGQVTSFDGKIKLSIAKALIGQHLPTSD